MQNYTKDVPVRPKAVDYEIGTNDTWNYALVPSKAMTFDSTPTAGWSDVLPFDTENYPFSIKVQARHVPEWGYWDNSKITADLPPSPVDCSKMTCGKETTLVLTPFGGTNIRIGVFPWISPSARGRAAGGGGEQ